jgi:hypothetical protein
MSPSDNPGLVPLAKERLGLLTTVGDGLSDEKSLRFGLDQAVGSARFQQTLWSR